MKQYVYTSTKDNRIRQIIIDDNGKHTSKSYPRVVMEEYLGRPLKDNEDVHHIDGDVTNNDISNLQIILHGKHQQMHSTKYHNTTEICQICGNKFIMTNKLWSRFVADIHRKTNKKRYLTCSKSCAGKMSSGKYKPLYCVDDRIKELYGDIVL